MSARGMIARVARDSEPTASSTLIRLEPAQAAFRASFLGWQCRLRQLSVRNAEGRPTSGMRPAVRVGAGPPLGQIVVLIVPSAPAESTAEFRHMVRRTNDPAERFKSALKTLAAHYYQYPQDFSERMTALFGPQSEIAQQLLAAGEASLRFEQYNQTYELPCHVSELPETDPHYQATYWHNSLFNPRIPPDARVLGFTPDWAHALADPQVD